MLRTLSSHLPSPPPQFHLEESHYSTGKDKVNNYRKRSPATCTSQQALLSPQVHSPTRSIHSPRRSKHSPTRSIHSPRRSKHSPRRSIHTIKVKQVAIGSAESAYICIVNVHVMYMYMYMYIYEHGHPCVLILT